MNTSAVAMIERIAACMTGEAPCSASLIATCCKPHSIVNSSIRPTAAVSRWLRSAIVTKRCEREDRWCGGRRILARAGIPPQPGAHRGSRKANRSRHARTAGRRSEVASRAMSPDLRPAITGQLDLIAEGIHERVILELARFHQRFAAKLQAARAS
jgi:hypothetical protein